MKIGFLHPGSMGVSIAASAISSGQTALWASDGRGSATRQRAEENGLQDVGNVAELCSQSDIICSICPPAAAEDIARAVAETGYNGIYVDGNAVSPERMNAVAEIVAKNGASVVDGAIIGHPAWKPGTTFLHLSGPSRADVAACFSGSVLTTKIMSDKIGEASALKMCYAALTKGTAALLCGILGTAEELGVRDALYQQWETDGINRSREREATVCGVTSKAWRWIDEMEEIARTFAGAGQPAGFHLASAEIFRRLSDLKDGPQPGEIKTVLRKLRGTE
jgi:3-hydroxyisobutyrate dehydrogenase-like beta-hydroxyacid dehydrogenase